MKKDTIVRKYKMFDEVYYTPLNETGLSYPVFKTETKILEKGFIQSDGYRPIVCDMIYDRDVPVIMRDGTTIYGDIFRPVDTTKTYPVVLVWTIYGKIFPPLNYDCFYNRAEMIKSKSCGLSTFEGPEPDYWVNNEYIVAVLDSRGSTYSEGDLQCMGNEMAYDVYDTIEWLGVQPWSSGKVGMIGNSALAIMQYFAAALKPPHLTAIAPWEGYSDFYRDILCRGGIPTPEFLDGINNFLRGRITEDLGEMIRHFPSFNEYWDKEKRVAFENIDLPTYLVASWSSNVHPYGTLRAWNMIASKEKWLRIHNTQEWPDQATPKYRDELRDFYDYYLKGIDNGWPNMPKVRVSLLDPMAHDVVDQAEADFPVPRTDYQKLYLNGNDNSLSFTPPEKEIPATYPVGEKKDGQIRFRLKLDKDMDLCGYFKAHFFVSIDKGDDMDLFMYVNKEDSMGIPAYPLVLGVNFMGAECRIRVSKRKVTKDVLWDYCYETTEREPLTPGNIYEINAIFWPLGAVFRKGETLVLTVSSANLQWFEFPTDAVATLNEGNHTIHTGGNYASYLEIPVI